MLQTGVLLQQCSGGGGGAAGLTGSQVSSVDVLPAGVKL